MVVSIIEAGEGSAADPAFSGDNRGFYIAAAGGAAYQNLAHITKAVQDKGFNVSIEDRWVLSNKNTRLKTLFHALHLQLCNSEFEFQIN